MNELISKSTLGGFSFPMMKKNIIKPISAFSKNKGNAINFSSEYPIINKYSPKVFYTNKPANERYGMSEFYPPEESYNPYPGNISIEVMDRNIKGDELTSLLNGEMLHYLPSVDNVYSKLKTEFINSYTKEQQEMFKNRYEYAKKNEGEVRSFDRWMDSVWNDAMIRGYLFPDKKDEFRRSNIYTEDQLGVLNRMMNYLKTGETNEQ